MNGFTPDSPIQQTLPLPSGDDAPSVAGKLSATATLSKEQLRYKNRRAELLANPAEHEKWKERERWRVAKRRAKITGKPIVIPSRKPDKPHDTREEMLAKQRAYNMLPHVKKRRIEQIKARLADPVLGPKIRDGYSESWKRNKQRVYAYRNNRRRTNIQFRLASNLRTYIGQRIGKKKTETGSRLLGIIGCTIQEFQSWIEAQFLPGMTWENYGRDVGEWSLDHVRPCASFDLSDPEQVKQCFSRENTRPMWCVENSRKNSFLPNGARAYHRPKIPIDSKSSEAYNPLSNDLMNE